MVTESKQELEQVAGNTPSSAESATGRFYPGDPRINRKGRPRKGETSFDYTKRLVEKPKHAKLVAEAKLERLLRTDSVGNRAWADYRDSYFGVPKQVLQVEGVDAASVADTLLTRMRELAGRQHTLPESTQTPAD